MFKRRDVQIPHQHSAARASARKPACGFTDKIKLMAEFRIGGAVRNIAAGGHVEIMHFNWAAWRIQHHAQMPAITLGAPIRIIFTQADGQAGKHRHAIIALHAAHQPMREAKCGDAFMRKSLIRAFGFLQADHIGRQISHQLLQQGQAQPHAIDIPGRDAKSLLRRAAFRHGFSCRHFWERVSKTSPAGAAP